MLLCSPSSSHWRRDSKCWAEYCSTPPPPGFLCLPILPTPWPSGRWKQTNEDLPFPPRWDFFCGREKVENKKLELKRQRKKDTRIYGYIYICNPAYMVTAVGWRCCCKVMTVGWNVLFVRCCNKSRNLRILHWPGVQILGVYNLTICNYLFSFCCTTGTGNPSKIYPCSKIL